MLGVSCRQPNGGGPAAWEMIGFVCCEMSHGRSDFADYCGHGYDTSDLMKALSL
jgi:hypothetical protein